MTSPTWPPPSARQLSGALKRNIESLEARRALEARQLNIEERIAEAITTFTGSMRFVYLHLAIYGCWIVMNMGVIPGVPRFDPSFVTLAMIASVEAIFLSTFVLISQNRMTTIAAKRADLDLQISLLAEHELTRVAEMVSAIAEHLNVNPLDHSELDEIKRDVEPEAVLDEIEARQNGSEVQ
jgi:uncharacterized membrane protein